jgi:type IV pilus assembly protein PilC
MGATRKLATAYHSLSTLLDAGMPIVRALNIVTEGLRGDLKKVFVNLSKSISNGESLSDSARKYPRVFGSLDVAALEAGERSGELGKSFKMLSEWYEFRGKIKKTIVSGLALPVLVIHIAAVVAPAPGLILGSTGLSGYLLGVMSILAWLYLPAAILIVSIFARRSVPVLAAVLDNVVVRIPVLGQAVREVSIFRYSKAFNMLYKAGVPITQCTAQAHSVTGNTVIAGWFTNAAKSSRDGNPAYLGLSPGLPIEYRNLWEIGEESGELDKTIDKIAEMAWDKGEFYFTEFVRWLPRLIYAMVCIVILMQILKLLGTISTAYTNFNSDF